MDFPLYIFSVYMNQNRTIDYQPPDPITLQNAREMRMQEMKMYDIFREIIFYIVFLWLLLVVSYNFRDPNAFLMKDALMKTITDSGMGHIKTFYHDYKKASNHIWHTSFASLIKDKQLVKLHSTLTSCDNILWKMRKLTNSYLSPTK